MRNPNTSFATSFAIALTLMSAGCATRVILVPNGDPVRLAEPVRAKVWVPDASGQIVQSQNRVTIPAGWYALPKK
jgi:hypothetical protein